MNIDISHISEQQLAERFGAPLHQLFLDADVDGDGHVSAEEAKFYFPKFNVPQQVLRTVWSQSCKTRGGLTRDEFEVAMKHIFVFLSTQQQQSPHFVPIRSSPSPSPMSMMGGINSGSNTPMTPTVNGNGSINFAITLEEKSAYERHFQGIAQGGVTVTEQQAMPFFQKAQLDDVTLRQIYRISDFEKDGLLDRDEFVIAFHLIRLKRKNPVMPIPDQVPDVLVPPNKRMLLMGGNSRASIGGGVMNPLMMQQNNMNRPPLMMGGGPSSSINVSGMNASQVEMHVNRLMDETKDVQANLFTNQQQNEQNRIRLEELMRQKAELEQQLDRDRTDLRQAEQEKMRLDVQSAELESKVAILTNDKNEMLLQVERVRQEVARLNDICAVAHQTEQELSSEMNGVRSTLQGGLDDFIQLKEQITELNFRVQEMQQERSSSEQAVFSKTQEASRLQSELRQAQSAYNQLSTEIAALKTRQQEFEKVAQSTQSELNQLVNQNNGLKEQLVHLQNQSQNNTSFSNTKLLKLKEVLKKAETFVSEFEDTMKKEFPDQASAISPVSISSANFTTRSSPSPQVAASSPQQTFTKPATPVSVPTPVTSFSPPVTATRPHSTSSFDEFDSEFDVDFAPAPTKTAVTASPQLPPAPQQQQNKIDDDWGASFDQGNTDDAWSTFDNNNSKITSGGFDAWDDFGSANPAPAAKQAAPKPSTDDDDWANF